jgi:G:T-mismatch repair DNA endonuclease (very short patch repair protein)
MPDVLTPAQRHRCMSHIRSKATKATETIALTPKIVFSKVVSL